MYYNLVRLLICSVIFVPIVILIKKKTEIFKKKIYILLLVLFFYILFIAISYIPFENSFINFSSPEAAYFYANHGTGKIAGVIEGDNSSLIIVSGTSNPFKLIPKSENGWKIGSQSFPHSIDIVSLGKKRVFIISGKTVEDTYIVVEGTVYQGEDFFSVSDNYESQFFVISNKTSWYEVFRFATYVENFDDSYSLYIDEEYVSLTENRFQFLK